MRPESPEHLEDNMRSVCLRPIHVKPTAKHCLCTSSDINTTKAIAKNVIEKKYYLTLLQTTLM